MKKSLYKTVRSGVFAAIICVCSFVVIPIGTVPVSAALLGVMLCAVVLSPVEAFCAAAVYVIMGAFGLPVFSGGSGGFGVLFSATGGYIWSYPLIALTVSLICKIKIKNTFLKYVTVFPGCIFGIAICYFCGTLQYILVTGANIYTAYTVCIVPFIPIDLAKALAAVAIGMPIRKRI